MGMKTNLVPNPLLRINKPARELDVNIRRKKKNNYIYISPYDPPHIHRIQ